MNTNITNAINSSSSFSGFMDSGTFTTGTNYYVPYYTPTYWYTTYQESKTEQAYKIIRALMKAKLVKITELNKFFELMDEIAKVL